MTFERRGERLEQNCDATLHGLGRARFLDGDRLATGNHDGERLLLPPSAMTPPDPGGAQIDQA